MIRMVKQADRPTIGQTDPMLLVGARDEPRRRRRSPRRVRSPVRRLPGASP
jgi:hypothetical protein